MRVHLCAWSYKFQQAVQSEIAATNPLWILIGRCLRRHCICNMQRWHFKPPCGRTKHLQAWDQRVLLLVQVVQSEANNKTTNLFGINASWWNYSRMWKDFMFTSFILKGICVRFSIVSVLLMSFLMSCFNSPPSYLFHNVRVKRSNIKQTHGHDAAADLLIINVSPSLKERLLSVTSLTHWH